MDDDLAPPEPGSEEEQLFLEGIALFNEGEFFEAHEIWEDVWRLAQGRRKMFFQGMIQLAVTLEHVRRGNPRGVRAVWASAQTKFENLPRVCAGIDHVALREAMRTFFAPIFALPESCFAPDKPRGQTLPVDLEAGAPKISLSR